MVNLWLRNDCAAIVTVSLLTISKEPLYSSRLSPPPGMLTRGVAYGVSRPCNQHTVTAPPCQTTTKRMVSPNRPSHVPATLRDVFFANIEHDIL